MISNKIGFVWTLYAKKVNVKSKILRNHWLRNYFVKLVDRDECKIIGTRLTMFGRRIVEFLHKRTVSGNTASPRYTISVKETTARLKSEENKFGKYVCVRTRQSGDRTSWGEFWLFCTRPCQPTWPYRYPISWEVFFDPSDSYFLFAEERGYHKWVLAHSSSCLICRWTVCPAEYA
jgi:hypothetical protein